MIEFDGEPGIRLVSPDDFEEFVGAVRHSLQNPESPAPLNPCYDVDAMTDAWDRVLDLEAPPAT
jgi:hypothetical protein